MATQSRGHGTRGMAIDVQQRRGSFVDDPKSSDVKSAPPSRYAWYVVAMLWCISFFNYADRQAVFSVFPLLEQELNLTSEELGWIGSSFALVYGLCAPLAGTVVD